jgi:hypothetical protein
MTTKSVELCQLHNWQSHSEGILEAFFMAIKFPEANNVASDVVERWAFAQTRPHQLVTDCGPGQNSSIFIAFDNDIDAVEYHLLFG